MLDRTIAPKAAILENAHELLKPETVVLDNGIPLHLMLSGSQHLVRIEFIFEAGTWHEDVENTSYLAIKLVSSGTKKYTAEQIEKTIAFYGAFIDLDNGPDRSTITIYSVSKHIVSLLPLIVDLITNSQLPEEEFNNLKNISLQNLKVNLAKTNYLASINFRKNIFGANHPYGKSLSEECLNKVEVSDVRNFFYNTFIPENCHIIVSGNGALDFYALFNNSFGTLKKGKTHNKKKVFDILSYSGSKIIPKENALQSSIRIGLPLFTLAHPDYFKTYILTEILGGYFGSRLMKNIREDKGFTYGIHANIVCYQNAGYFVIGTDVDKENTQKTIDEIYKEISILKHNLVSFDELDTVKNYMLGSFFNSINTPFALADKFKMIYFNGLDYTFYKNYIKTIETVNASQILEMANKYFNKEEMLEVIAG